MSSPWDQPDRDPSSPDGDLDALARLYRDHPPPEPPEPAWRWTLTRVEVRLVGHTGRRGRWPLALGLVGAAAAALFGGVLLARSLWPTPTTAEERLPQVAAIEVDDEPFPVAQLSEIHILRMDPNDADRVVLGQPLIGTMEFVLPEEIDLVEMGPAGAGKPPVPQRDAGAPMIIVATAAVSVSVGADNDEP